MLYKRSEIETAVVEKLPGNIFHVSVKDGAEIDLIEAKRLIHLTNSMLEPDFELRGGIYDLSKITYIHEEARDYFSEGSEIEGTVVGVAIISNSFLGRVIGNLFINLIGKQNFPIQFFESPMRAEHWVRSKMESATNMTRREEISRVA
jgi:hypothetical protein